MKIYLTFILLLLVSVNTAPAFTSHLLTFSLCTQQPESNLTISMKLANSIPSGSNNFFLTYDAWPALSSKDLLTDAGSTTAFYSTDNTVFNTAIYTPDTTNKIITVSFNNPSSLAIGSNLYILLVGVNSPPTKTTTLTTAFSISTANNAGTKINQAKPPTVADTCVTNYTTGIVDSATFYINTLIPGPAITFGQTPIITVLPGDTIQLYYTPYSSLKNCGTLKLWRDNTTTTSLPLTQNTTFATYTNNIATTPNIQYTFPFSLDLTSCTNFLVPPSSSPTALAFIFKRGTSPYLGLSAKMYPWNTAISTSNSSFTTSSTQMTASSTFTYTVTINQTLGSTPGLQLALNSPDIIVTSPTCTASLSTGTATGCTCTYNSTTWTLFIGFTASSSLALGTTITVGVSGITNPIYPNTYNFGISTLYDNSNFESRVQVGDPLMFAKTFTEVLSLTLTITPSTFTAYSNTLTSISFTTPVPLPTLTTITFTFPTNVNGIIITSTPLKSNNTILLLDGFPSVSGLVVTIRTKALIPANNVILFQFTMKTPAQLGTYNYVTINAVKNSTTYINSTTNLGINVNKLNTLPCTISPAISYTGVTTSYNIALTLSVPHPASFKVQVTYPSDITFINAGISCNGDCASTVTIQPTFIIITANNPMSGNTGQTLKFAISSNFINPRSTSNGSAWQLATKTISPSTTIAVTSAAPIINNPSLINATLSSTDQYYYGSTAPVTITMKFTNNLIAGDYILLQVTSIYFKDTVIQCDASNGTCIEDTTATGGNLVVKITPNLPTIVSKTYTVTISGLVSTSNNTAGSLLVSSYNATGFKIDSGTIAYQLTCLSTLTTNKCKTCHTNGSCTACYTSTFLYDGKCTSSCGDATQNSTYLDVGSGSCVPCINNCVKCLNSIYCLSCTNTTMLKDQDNTCISSCPTIGYVALYDNYNIQHCYKCADNNCYTCLNEKNDGCTVCTNSTNLFNGSCRATCPVGLLSQSNKCVNCDFSCYDCTALGPTGCISCATDYFQVYSPGLKCVDVCPSGLGANSSGVCICDAPCQSCFNKSTYCKSCLNTSLFAYKGVCQSGCPGDSYLNGSQCVPCSQHCLKCSASECFQCDNTTHLYNKVCYGGVRVERPPEKQLPAPGTITLFVSLGITFLVKVLLPKTYTPYASIVLSSVIQFAFMFAMFSKAQNTITDTRLLYVTSAQKNVIVGLMTANIAFNYVLNMFYVLVFVKYIKPLIHNPRKIDIIAHAIVLLIGCGTNYRFCLLVFSKILPTPQIHIDNPAKLTQVHYLCIISIFADLFSIIASGIALANDEPFANLFMLSLDLIVIIVMNTIITIWFITKQKPKEYFDEDLQKQMISQNQDQHVTTSQNFDNQKDIPKNTIFDSSLPASIYDEMPEFTHERRNKKTSRENNTSINKQPEDLAYVQQQQQKDKNNIFKPDQLQQEIEQENKVEIKRGKRKNAKQSKKTKTIQQIEDQQIEQQS